MVATEPLWLVASRSSRERIASLRSSIHQWNGISITISVPETLLIKHPKTFHDKGGEVGITYLMNNSRLNQAAKKMKAMD
jgi:hypothetical protein